MKHIAKQLDLYLFNQESPYIDLEVYQTGQLKSIFSFKEQQSQRHIPLSETFKDLFNLDDDELNYYTFNMEQIIDLENYII